MKRTVDELAEFFGPFHQNTYESVNILVSYPQLKYEYKFIGTSCGFGDHYDDSSWCQVDDGEWKPVPESGVICEGLANTDHKVRISFNMRPDTFLFG
jgi:hypothetical protein